MDELIESLKIKMSSFSIAANIKISVVAYMAQPEI